MPFLRDLLVGFNAGIIVLPRKKKTSLNCLLLIAYLIFKFYLSLFSLPEPSQPIITKKSRQNEPLIFTESLSN